MVPEFKSALLEANPTYTRRVALEIVQVNLGNRCNQQCEHCHVGASPEGDKIMSLEVVKSIISFLKLKKGLILDITGGCPEFNPNLKYLIKEAKPLTKMIMVRSNLTIFFEPGMESFPKLYRDNKVKIISSLPCYTKENVDKQRGDGVFEKSIKALKSLNELGYGREPGLELDLVYNPGGAFLPGAQSSLENDYKKILKDEYGVFFSHLLTIINAPIKRFENYLKANGSYDEYMKLLQDNFNKDIAGDIMCRNLLSIGWDGVLYDCDFNQALELSLKKNIADVNPDELNGNDIIFQDHCYCCTAGAGSSCGGALK